MGKKALKIIIDLNTNKPRKITSPKQKKADHEDLIKNIIRQCIKIREQNVQRIQTIQQSKLAAKTNAKCDIYDSDLPFTENGNIYQDNEYNKLHISETSKTLPRVDIVFNPNDLIDHKILRQIEIQNKIWTAALRQKRSCQQIKMENLGKKVEESLSHQKRIDMIFLTQVHGISIQKAAVLTDSHYSTVRNVKEAYKLTGRTNKLLTFQTKQLLLKQRNELQKSTSLNVNKTAAQKPSENISQIEDKQIDSDCQINQPMRQNQKCQLNIYVNQSDEHQYGSLEVFSDARQYPYQIKSPGTDESNFTNIKQQVEKVDYNFYDNENHMMINNAYIYDNNLLSKRHLQIQEKEAYKMYHQIFKQPRIKQIDLVAPETI